MGRPLTTVNAHPADPGLKCAIPLSMRGTAHTWVSDLELLHFVNVHVPELLTQRAPLHLYRTAVSTWNHTTVEILQTEPLDPGRSCGFDKAQRINASPLLPTLCDCSPPLTPRRHMSIACTRPSVARARLILVPLHESEHLLQLSLLPPAVRVDALCAHVEITTSNPWGAARAGQSKRPLNLMGLYAQARAQCMC